MCVGGYKDFAAKPLRIGTSDHLQQQYTGVSSRGWMWSETCSFCRHFVSNLSENSCEFKIVIPEVLKPKIVSTLFHNFSHVEDSEVKILSQNDL